MATTRTELDGLMYLAQQAFDGDAEASLIANLNSVTDSEWRLVSPGGARAIVGIAIHATGARLAYAAALTGTTGDEAWAEAGGHIWDSLDQLRAWLFEAQTRWLAALAAVDPAVLDRPHLAPWDGALPLRQIVARLVAHDFYHAGEINHLRGMLQGNDGWDWEQ